jgi:opacity protein-like surface antigen
MHKTRSIALGALAALALAGAGSDAWAQLYFAGSAGAEFLRDGSLTSTGSGTNGSGELTYDTGFGGAAALGYAFGRVRIEAEGFYRSSDLSQFNQATSGITVGTVTVTGAGTKTATGDQSALGALANLYYDFHTGTGWTPFVGGGIGMASISLKIDRLGATAVNFDESETVLAYQFGAGFSYQFTPRAAVTIGYRYFATADADLQVGGTTDTVEYSSHNVQLGIRYGF